MNAWTKDHRFGSKYLLLDKLTLELGGVPKALSKDFHSGAVALLDIAQTLLLQLTDLRDLVCRAMKSNK